MPWDSQATKRRLVEAAVMEFSANGIAGARVDRIASAAKANKQAIYAYFGSKDALFAAAFEDRIRDFDASVAFDEYDLAEYGGRMFDKFEDAPATLRLVLWYQVERASGPPLDVIVDSNEDKVRRIAAAQREGKVTGTYPAVVLLSLARSTALMWHTQIPELAAAFPSDRCDRREMVVHVLRRVLAEGEGDTRRGAPGPDGGSEGHDGSGGHDHGGPSPSPGPPRRSGRARRPGRSN